MPLQADSAYWGPVSGDFSTPANWLDASGNPLVAFPGPGDDLCIQSSNADSGTWYQTLLGTTAPPNDVNNVYVGNWQNGGEDG